MITQQLDDIIDSFTLLDDWEDRYRYLIELGHTLPAMPPDDHTPANKVNGCVSQVWLIIEWLDGRAKIICDSDAHIVRGLLAILIAIYANKTPYEILETDALAVFRSLQLQEHLTPQRSNGLKAFIERIHTHARLASR